MHFSEETYSKSNLYRRRLLAEYTYTGCTSLCLLFCEGFSHSTQNTYADLTSYILNLY